MRALRRQDYGGVRGFARHSDKGQSLLDRATRSAPPPCWLGVLARRSVAGRDILAYQFVEEFGAGETAEPGDPAAIDRAILELYCRWSDGMLGVPPDVRARTLARFSRRQLTARLAEVLDAVAAERA